MLSKSSKSVVSIRSGVRAASETHLKLRHAVYAFNDSGKAGGRVICRKFRPAASSTAIADGAPTVPVTVVRYGEETVRVLQVFGVEFLRRESDGRINATQLLKAAAISRGEVRRALLDLRRRFPAKRMVVHSRHIVLRGAWFPPEECEELAKKYDQMRSLFA
ncbi:hypothetical protein HDU77_009502 [Chytriomyces hyalinus]|nr:hypothetical protein HDU77_009502 [Chytriomyces hyalinus]